MCWVIYRDPDGNEIGFGGSQQLPLGAAAAQAYGDHWQRWSSHLRVVKRMLFGASDAA